MKRDNISLPLDLGSELIIDNFAGGGGASTGLERAFGRPVDVAINHDPEALAMHAANHPQTVHYCESVFDVDPIAITGNQPVALVWLSPDCKHFSKAKGGKPVSKKIRGLAWIAIRWCLRAPRAFMLENVEEFVTWGDLMETSPGVWLPDPAKKGETFKAFLGMLTTGIDVDHPALVEVCEVLEIPIDGPDARRLVNGLGYKVECRELRACDYGAPTIRKRFFMVGRRDHLPIAWPAPTHGDPKSADVRAGNLLPWRTAADCIDWTLPCPSIFERAKPLKDATLRRVAKGIMKFVVNSTNPFILSVAHSTTTGRGPNVWSIDEPLRTITGANDKYIVAPTLMHVTHHGGDRTASVDAPIATVTGANRGEQALVGATLEKIPTFDEWISATKSVGGTRREYDRIYGCDDLAAATLIQTGYGEREGQEPRVPGLDKPLGTAVAGGVKHAVVCAFLAKHYGGHESSGAALDKPTSTITTQDHHHLVSSHLVKLRNNQFGQDVREPMPTLTAGGGHVGEVRTLLQKYHGPDALGIVTIGGEQYAIVDIGMRMLQPHELKLAQGFPYSYVIDPVVNGKPLSKSSQVRMIGNSVCPDVATALIVANFAHEKQMAGNAA
ncbi:DNA cytosine methyltransferase [Paraburkholderia unamae]|uniref:DNA (cytosine-5-)-methyltransferase n=1 Tax=Paraburkholderia unamae TaxID=219649 RepID=A0ABX5KAR1_9BURK|nr:DNA cytosine methyltransferase [Paraburkholderia unamae]PVX61287.1 DNA (cytosine-5)-methyltransferase 1 [Paraburkholderia unamae]